MCYRFYVDVLLLCLLMRVFKPELQLGNAGKQQWRVIVACQDTSLVFWRYNNVLGVQEYVVWIKGFAKLRGSTYYGFFIYKVFGSTIYVY